MDILATLKKLHRQFPQLSLDDLLAILDCYVEKTTLHFPYEPKMPYDNKIWYSNSDMTANNLN